jgi:preprotein translocase subunit YajC
VGGFALLLVYLAIFVAIIWLFVVVPQRRIRRQQAEMMSRLSPGHEVMTTGGIYGTITEIEDGDTLLLEVAEDTEIRVAKASVARLVTDQSGTVPDPASDGTTE